MKDKSSRKIAMNLPLSTTTTYQAGVVQATMYRVLKKFTDDCLKEYGITSMQWFVIGTIYDTAETGIGVTELSRKVDTNIPYITNTIHLLESKGIVVKEDGPRDSRVKIVKISDQFRPQCLQIENDLRRKMRVGIYSHIEPRDLQVYMHVMHKLSMLA